MYFCQQPKECWQPVGPTVGSLTTHRWQVPDFALDDRWQTVGIANELF